MMSNYFILVIKHSLSPLGHNCWPRQILNARCYSPLHIYQETTLTIALIPPPYSLLPAQKGNPISTLPRPSQIFREHFPSEMQEDSSQDILLMCTKCLKDSKETDIEFSADLARSCNAMPVGKTTISQPTVSQY